MDYSFPLSSITNDTHLPTDGPTDEPTEAQTEAYRLHQTLSIPHHMPLNLKSLHLISGHIKPSIPNLITLAIWGSPGRRLTLKDITRAVESEFENLKTQSDQKWRRSIRHSLSYKDMFVKTKPPHHHGKAHYWKLLINVFFGNKNRRTRKRTGEKKTDGKKKQAGQKHRVEFEMDDPSDSSSSSDVPAPAATFLNTQYPPPSHPIPQYPSPNPIMGNTFGSPTWDASPSTDPRPAHAMLWMPLCGHESFHAHNEHTVGPATRTNSGQVIQDFSLIRGAGHMAVGYDIPRADKRLLTLGVQTPVHYYEDSRLY